MFVIVHKNNIAQANDHQSTCELFQSCLYDQNQNRRATGFQSFDTGPITLSLKKTTKKICRAVSIILLQFLTLSCR